MQQGNISNVWQTEDWCLADSRLTDPRDDKTRIVQQNGGLFYDSYRWILNSREFLLWRQNTDSRLLWIKGDRGKGKTMALCGIIDELRTSMPNSIVSFFFCEPTSEFDNATAVLRGLTYLLLNHQQSLIPHLQKRYNVAGKQMFEDKNAFFVLSDIFQTILAQLSSHNVVIIIDAIDECKVDLQHLLKLIDSTRPGVRWVITSRTAAYDEENLNVLQNAIHLCLEANENLIENAIRPYIHHRVKQLVQLMKCDEKTRDHFQGYLLLNSDNNFLWVNLVCKELRNYYLRNSHSGRHSVSPESILAKLKQFRPGLESFHESEATLTKDQPLQDFLEAMRNMSMPGTEHKVPLPLFGTCEWVFAKRGFRSWMDSPERSALLCIHGRLGSGKSTLMRYIVTSLQRSPQDMKTNIAAFFNVSPETGMSPNTPAEIYRALLIQLLRNPSFRSDAANLVESLQSEFLLSVEDVEMHRGDFCTILKDIFRKPRYEATIIFIDAVDKCTDPDEILQFFEDISPWAPAARLKICFTAQKKFPIISSPYEDIPMEKNNVTDIASYLDKRLPVSSALPKEKQTELQRSILKKASGVFLWVVSVVNLLRGFLNKGEDFRFLLKVIENTTPDQMTTLYQSIIRRSLERNDQTEIYAMICLMRWVLFSARPLTLEEWHHVYAFISIPNLRSVSEWKDSEWYTESHETLLQKLETVCGGFVVAQEREVTDAEVSSRHADAGSFAGRLYIDVIHSTVRQFFLKGDGFKLLDPDIRMPVGEGHAYILDVCVRYCFLNEMKAVFWPRPSKRRSEPGDIYLSPTSARFASARPYSLEESDSESCEVMSLGSSANTTTRSVPRNYHRRRRPGDNSRANLFPAITELASPSESVSGEIAHRRKAIWAYLDNLEVPVQGDGIEILARRDTNNITSTTDPFPEHMKVVDHPPELWQYCEDMLVDHAVAAEKAGVIPKKTLGFILRQNFKAWGASRTDMRDGATLEYFAAQWNLVSWLKYFRRQRRYITHGGFHKYPIIVAAKSNSLEAFEYLVRKRNVSLFHRDRYRRTLFHYAAMVPDSSVLSFISQLQEENRQIAAPSVVNIKDCAGQTALHLAAITGSATNIQTLLAMGASVNISDAKGNTPLHLACLLEVSDLNMCEALVKAGSDSNCTNTEGKTASQLAQKYGNFQLVNYLATNHLGHPLSDSPLRNDWATSNNRNGY
ncbi:het-domain-containing protein [Fusarium pseudocircinatum]|uniref:Het-domain-containing protein n=1 Tax=Fusarium pseudocircinatum TaxID=56676 RepID=A0A8H5UYV0_9HYPO|nr:het-domain-containing protein [Fusarium pseudocircinatum]